jgi:hypothetical protein
MMLKSYKDCNKLNEEGFLETLKNQKYDYN